MFLHDFLFRDSATTYFGPAVLQYVNRGIGNDCEIRKTKSNLVTRLSRVKNGFQSAIVVQRKLSKQYEISKQTEVASSTSMASKAWPCELAWPCLAPAAWPPA